MSSRKLRQWVEEKVACGRPGEQLPSDRELAHQFGISHATVRRMMARLAAQGVVERYQGRGTFVPGGSPVESRGDSTQRAASGSRTVVDEIVRCIGAGELRRGDQLPPYKVLCANLHVSPNTVRSAYAELEHQGLVTKVGKYYHVGRFIDIARITSRREVVLFADENTDISTLFTTHEAALAFNKMERELAAFGLFLSYERLGNMGGKVDEWLGGGRFPQAVILTGSDMQAVVSERDYQRVRHALERLLREAGIMRPRILVLTTAFQVPNPFIVWFSISHAVMMMRRKLAWFLTEKGFAAADYFHAEDDSTRHLILDALRMVPEVDHFRPGFPLRFVVRPEGGDLSRERFFGRVFSLFSREHIEARLSKYRRITLEDVAQMFVLVADFSEAYAQRQPNSLWIFEQEAWAIDALDWCAAHRVAVPHDISVIGLENRREFAERGLSACVRDWETMGYLMAHALIGDIPLQRTRRGFVAYDALLLERRTTR